MLDGTYRIYVYLGKEFLEENRLVLYTADDVLSGYIGEIFGQPVPLSNGAIRENEFTFEVPPFATIMGDISLRLKGMCEGDHISGTMSTPIGKLPFTGTRIGEAKLPS